MKLTLKELEEIDEWVMKKKKKPKKFKDDNKRGNKRSDKRNGRGMPQAI